MKKFYYTEKKGNGYAIGTREQRESLGNRSYLIPLIWENNNMWIAKNEIFYTTANAARMRKKVFLKNIKYMRSYWLNDNDKKQLQSLLVSFSLEQFHSWMKVDDYVISCQNEVIFYPYPYYGSFGSPSYDVAGFRCTSNNMLKYKKWLGTDNAIFCKPFIKKIPAPLSYCKQLFDRNVLEIKKLVKDSGNLTPLIHKEQQKNYMMTAILLLTHSLLSLMKKYSVMDLFH